MWILCEKATLHKSVYKRNFYSLILLKTAVLLKLTKYFFFSFLGLGYIKQKALLVEYITQNHKFLSNVG